MALLICIPRPLICIQRCSGQIKPYANLQWQSNSDLCIICLHYFILLLNINNMAFRADTTLDDIMNNMRANLNKRATKNSRTAHVASGGLMRTLGVTPAPVSQQNGGVHKKCPSRKRLIDSAVTKTKNTSRIKKGILSSMTFDPFSWRMGANVFDEINHDDTSYPGGIESNITCSRGSRIGLQDHGSDLSFTEDNNYSIGSSTYYNKSQKENKSSNQLDNLFWQSSGPAIHHFMNIDKSITHKWTTGMNVSMTLENA